jgi:hypothetical protein
MISFRISFLHFFFSADKEDSNTVSFEEFINEDSSPKSTVFDSLTNEKLSGSSLFSSAAERLVGSLGKFLGADKTKEEESLSKIVKNNISNNSNHDDDNGDAKIKKLFS